MTVDKIYIHGCSKKREDKRKDQSSERLGEKFIMRIRKKLR
jgi:hypothetical protein